MKVKVLSLPETIKENLTFRTKAICREVSLRSGVTMLNNIVDNIEQCWQQNIVQCCFQQP